MVRDAGLWNDAGLPVLFLHIGANPIIGPADHVVQDRSRPAHDAIGLKTGDEMRRENNRSTAARRPPGLRARVSGALFRGAWVEARATDAPADSPPA